MNKQKGFTLVEGLLIVLILCVVGFAGYTVWNNQQDEETDQAETVQQEEQSQQKDSEISENTEQKTSNAQLKSTFSHNYYNPETKASDIEFSISYPSTWVAATTEGSRCTVNFVISKEQNHSVCVLERGFGVEDPTIVIEDTDYSSPDGATYNKKLFKNSETGVVGMVSYIPKYSTPFDAILISGIPDGEYNSLESQYDSVVNSISL